MSRVPYFERTLPALRGDDALYHRMDRLFDLSANPAFAEMLAGLEVWAEGGPSVLAAMDRASVGCAELIDTYDDVTYLFMLYDWCRMVAYENAITRRFAGARRPTRTLEIGCGGVPILSWMLYEAGARDLVAFETKPQAYRSARDHFLRRFAVVDEQPRTVVMCDERGVRVTLHNRYSTDIDLGAEPKFDLFVHEILGDIASMEGCVEIYNRTLDLLADDAVVVPARSQSFCAPVARLELDAAARSRSARSAASGPVLANEHLSDPQFEAGGFYLVMRFPHDRLLADPQPFEDLDFAALRPLPLTGQADLRFAPRSTTEFDGLVLSMAFDTDAMTRVDTLASPTAWPQIYVRLFDEPIPVGERHEIRVRVERDVSLSAMFYAFRVTVSEGGRRIADTSARVDLA